MSRFFKSAAFPILIVIVLAFFASKLIQEGNEAPPTKFDQFRETVARYTPSIYTLALPRIALVGAAIAIPTPVKR